MIGQWNSKDKRWLILSNRNKRAESVRTIEELSLEFVPQTFKRYFQNFLLKANQQFVEILPTTYIFQPRSIYNIAGKVVWSIKKRYDQIYWCVNRSQLYAANQHLSLFRFR